MSSEVLPVVMTRRVGHPYLLTAFRVTLYIAAAVVVCSLAVALVAVLGVVALAGLVALLSTGDATASLATVVAVGGITTLVVAGVSFLAFVVARRLDRAVTDRLSLPDPLEVAMERYVVGEYDETELERRLERLLTEGDRALPTDPER
jgi:uncharacterized membrane protein